MAQAAIRKYRIQEGAPYLPVLLISHDSSERWVGVKGIQEFQKGDGFPYYAAMLYDSDADVACEAARSFAFVNDRDADPILYRFLNDTSNDKKRQVVVKTVVQALCHIHHKDCPETVEDIKLPDVAEEWMRRLHPSPENMHEGVQPEHAR